MKQVDASVDRAKAREAKAPKQKIRPSIVTMLLAAGPLIFLKVK